LLKESEKHRVDREKMNLGKPEVSFFMKIRGDILFAKIKKFLSEVKAEIKKVVWPSRNEVYGTTIVVLITVFIFSLFLYFADTILFSAISYLLNVFK